MNRKTWDDKRLQLLIANLLRAGVLLAAGIVLAGGLVFLARHGSEPFDRRAFQGEPPDLRSVGGVLRGVAALHGRDIIQFGLLVLMATPIARVALAVFGFLRQGDRLYVGITLLVLGLLAYSLGVGRL